jgi:hypothetical protein
MSMNLNRVIEFLVEDDQMILIHSKTKKIFNKRLN